MSKQRTRKKGSYRQSKYPLEQPQLLAPPQEEAIPEMVKGLKRIVACLDLSALESSYDDKGGFAYPPRLMLAMLLFGLMDGERSSRKLQEHCRYDVRYRYLMEGLEPDDRTIGRFRERLEGVLAALFTQVLELARQEGLVKMQVVALDGTKVAGSLSQWKRVLAQAKETDVLESGGGTVTESEARTMKTRRQGYVNGYNAQVMVDAQSGVVLATHVSNQAADSPHLPVMLEAVQETTGALPQVLLADKGYDSAENAQALEQAHVQGYVHPRETDEFWQVGEDGAIRCAAGEGLVKRDQYVHGTKLEVRWWVKGCPHCPRKAECGVKTHKYLTHPLGVDPAARLRNAQRCRSSQGQALLRQRAPSVEGFFGQWKGNRDFRRFRVRGLERVNGELRLECVSYNLRKVLVTFIGLFLALLRRQPPSLSDQKSPFIPNYRGRGLRRGQSSVLL